MEAYPEKAAQKNRLEKKLEELRQKDINLWKQQQEELEEKCRKEKAARDAMLRQIEKQDAELEALKREYISRNEELAEKEKSFVKDAAQEQKVAEFFSGRENPNYERLQASFFGKARGVGRGSRESHVFFEGNPF